jgi:hypothetical protein
MSEPSLLHPQSVPSPQNQSPSSKSGKQAISKSLKHAFSRRKRSIASFRSGKDGSDLDLSSQRSGSVGPETFLSDEPPEVRVSEEVVLDSSQSRYVCTFRARAIHSSPNSNVLTLFPFKSATRTFTFTKNYW